MTNQIITVRGKVQGVGFRYFTKLKADELGLTGTVQNQEDGSVLIQVCGSENGLRLFIEWCHQGPASAFVSELEYRPLEKGIGFEDFSIIR